MTLDLDLLRSLPKVSLHDHLDGGLRPATVFEIAAEIGHPLPADSPEALGERLLGVVVAAAQRGWDVEDALREAVRRYAGELDAAAHARP